MQRLSAITVLACVTMAGSSAAVHAADIIVEQPPVYVEEAPAYAAAPEYTGWYLRADAGYVFESETDGDYLFYNQFTNTYDDRYHYDEIRLDRAFSFGAGAGYRFAKHFRADVTADYFQTDVKGSTACPLMLGFNSDCRFDDSSEADIWTAMANAYVDLPYFGAVTPYFGAGLGFAHVSYGELRNEQDCGSSPNCPTTPFVGTHEGEESWRFASSLMAGASIDLTQQLKLDAGYKYTRIYKGDAFGFDEFDKSFGASGVQGRDHGFNVHAVRAGLRYEFY